MGTGGMKVDLVYDQEEQCYDVTLSAYLGDKKQIVTHWSPAAARQLAINIVKAADLALQRDAEATAAAKGLLAKFHQQEGA